MRTFSFFLGLALCLAPSIHAQVTIGAGTEPNAGSLLDLKENEPDANNATATKGFGMPRVQLTDLTQLYPMFTSGEAKYSGENKTIQNDKHIGLTVYSIKSLAVAAPAGPITRGVYIWGGTKWHRIIEVPDPIPTTPPVTPVDNTTFTGRTLFDIGATETGAADGYVRGTLATRKLVTSHYNVFSTTNTFTYTFATQSGDNVSNVNFEYANTNGSVISTISPTGKTVTVTYDKTLLTTAKTKILHGITGQEPLTADITVVYDNNGVVGLRKTLKVIVQDGSFCGAYTGANRTQWTNFMCHNLGATQSLDPFVPSKGINGVYYQWGQKTASLPAEPTAAQIAAMPIPENRYILPPYTWAGSTKASYDPCPTGYRVPSDTQWNNIIENYKTDKNRVGPITIEAIDAAPYATGVMYGTSLFLSHPGYCTPYVPENGSSNKGRSGYFWSNVLDSNNMTAKRYSTGYGTNTVASDYGIYAMSVRCIAQGY